MLFTVYKYIKIIPLAQSNINIYVNLYITFGLSYLILGVVFFHVMYCTTIEHMLLFLEMCGECIYWNHTNSH